MKQLVFVCLLLVPSLLFAKAVQHEIVPLNPEQELRAATLGGMLKCPVCKSQSLAGSTSFMAEEMKRQIRLMIQEGQSDEAILDYFVERYSEWILLQPRASGVNWALYLFPVLVFLVGAAWIVVRIRTTQPRITETNDSQPVSDDAYTAMAENLLQKEVDV